MLSSRAPLLRCFAADSVCSAVLWAPIPSPDMRPPRRRWPAAAALFLFILLARGAPGARAGAAPPRPHVLDHAAFAYFAVELGAGADPEAVAVDAGLELVGPLPPLDGHWLLRAAHPPGDLAARSLDPDSPSSHHGRLLRRVERHPNVEWASLQVPKRRLFRRELPKRSVYGKAELNAIWKDQLDIKDPGAPRQWHLVNIRFGSGGLRGIIGAEEVPQDRFGFSVDQGPDRGPVYSIIPIQLPTI